MSDPGVEYRLYLDQFRQDVAELKTLMTGAGDEAEREVKNLDSVMKTVGTGMLAYFTFDAIKEITGEIISLTAEFEKYKAVLTNSLGSEEAAVAVMDKLQKFAANTPNQLNELTDSFVKLVGQGFQPTMDEMTSLGDLASSKAKGFDQLTEALLDAMMGENERLKEFGIKAQKNGDIIKYTFKGVTTEVANNEEAIKRYILSLGRMEGVQGSMAAISKTLGGAMSNAADSTDNLYNVIGSKLSPSLIGLYGDYSNITNALAEWIKNSPVQELQNEKEEVNLLTIQLQDVNIEEETREKLLIRLKELAPDVAAAIDSESGSMEELNIALESYNKNMALKILMAENDLAIEKQRSGRGGVQDYLKLRAESEAELIKEMNSSLEWFAKKGPEYSQKVKEILIDNTLSTVKKAEQINSLALQATSLGNSSLYGALNSYKIFTKKYHDESRTLKQMIEDANALVEQYKNILGVKDEEVDPTKPDPDEPDEDLEEALKKWKKNLQEQKQAYKEYEAIKSEISKDEADELYDELLKKATSYQDLLKKILSEPLNKEQKAFVALELSSFSKKNKTPKAKAKEESTEYYDALLLATQNYNEKIGDLTLKYQKDRLLLQKNGHKDRIKLLDKQFDAEFYNVQKSHGVWDWLFIEISKIGENALNDYIKELEGFLNDERITASKRLDIEKALVNAKNAMSVKNLRDRRADLTDLLESEKSTAEQREQIERDLNETRTILMRAWSEAINEAVLSFEMLADALEELDGEADETWSNVTRLGGAIGDIVGGYASKDYGQMFEGILELIQLAADVIGEQMNHTEEMNDALEERERLQQRYLLLLDEERIKLDQILNRINNDYGIEKINAYAKAFYRMRKELDEIKNQTYSLHGDIKTDSYQGSTDANYDGIVEAYENMMHLIEQGYNIDQSDYDFILQMYDDYIARQNELNELTKEYKEYLTGTTFDAISDDIVKIFEEAQLAGDDFAEAFGDKFDKVMYEALVNNFRNKKVLEAVEEWYDEFAKAIENNVVVHGEVGDRGYSYDVSDLSPEEIEALQTSWSEKMGGLTKDWEFLVAMFPEIFGMAEEVAEVFGTSFETIGDEITQMFLDAQLEGESFVDKFGEHFEQTMQDALVSQFKDQVVMSAIEDWYKQFSDAANDAEGLTPEEIETLRTNWYDAMGDINQEWSDMMGLFDEFFTGDSSESAADQSTAGAIQQITEPTANILAGHTGAIRVFTSDMSKKLDKLTSIDNKLANIEKYTKATKEALTNSSF